MLLLEDIKLAYGVALIATIKTSKLKYVFKNEKTNNHRTKDHSHKVFNSCDSFKIKEDTSLSSGSGLFANKETSILVS